MNEGQINHLKVSWAEIRDRVACLMEKVGLHREEISRYPHLF